MNHRIVRSERRSISSGSVHYRAATYTALILINRVGDVKSTFAEPQRPDGVTRYLQDDATRLRPEIETAVMLLMEALDQRENPEALLAVIDGGSIMRLSPLLGSGEISGESMYALVIEADRNQECIARAVNRYRLTKRQTDVLLNVLEGANASEVARALHISEYTAQGYIKTLLTKTASRNRTAMVAKILEWPTNRSPRDSEIRLKRRVGDLN